MAILGTIQSSVGKHVVSGSWLDAGCGSGGIASSLARYVGGMTGIDPEPWPQWLELTNACDRLKFEVGKFDGSNQPFSEESFDVVICNQVYEHVADPRALLRNIHQILRPRGCCYFAGPNLLWPIEPHVFWPFVHWLPRPSAHRLMRRLGSKRADELDAFSTHYWQLIRWFREAGFEYKSAIAARLHAGLELGRTQSALQVLHWLDRPIDMLAPCSPSFVFILRRRM